MIIFNKNDFKYKNWSRALAEVGCETITNKKIYPYILVLLFQHIIKGKKINAYVFRYLNDRKSFFKTLINFLTDIFIILICKLKKIKIVWIAHNLNKESQVYHKLLNFLRRKVVMLFSNKILVTDPLLINFIQENNLDKRKIDWLCFGKPIKQKINLKNENLLKKIINYKNSLKKEFKNDNLILGLCVTSSLPKFYHFLSLNKLINNLNKYSNKQFSLILIGKFPKGKNFSLEKDKIKNNKNILHLDENFNVNEDYIKSEIDFIYRSVNDFSVSFSVYVSAFIGKPIITDNIGFLPYMIKKYKLGYIIPENKNNFKSFAEKIKNWDSTYAHLFLSKRSWKIAAKKLISISS